MRGDARVATLRVLAGLDHLGVHVDQLPGPLAAHVAWVGLQKGQEVVARRSWLSRLRVDVPVSLQCARTLRRASNMVL